MEDRVFSIVAENKPLPGMTISGKLTHNITCFSLAACTDISAESYPVPVLLYVLAGTVELYNKDDNSRGSVSDGGLALKRANSNIGMIAKDDSVYIEIPLGKENDMNEILKDGEVFALKELIPYQDGKIVNLDIASNEHMKFVVMAFDEGTGLSEHSAPGDAIVFALDGEGVIGYEGEKYEIKAGEQFRFKKGGLHSVTAEKKFKMALLLILD